MGDKVYEWIRLDNTKHFLIKFYSVGTIAKWLGEKVKVKFPNITGLNKVRIVWESRNLRNGRNYKSSMKVFNLHLSYEQLLEFFGKGTIFGKLCTLPRAPELQRVKLTDVLRYNYLYLNYLIEDGEFMDVMEYDDKKILAQKSVIMNKRSVIEGSDGLLRFLPYIPEEPEPVRSDPLFWIHYKTALQAFNVAYQLSYGDKLMDNLKTGEKGDYADVSGLTDYGKDVYLVDDYDNSQCCICKRIVKLTGILGDLSYTYNECDCDHEIYIKNYFHKY